MLHVVLQVASGRGAAALDRLWERRAAWALEAGLTGEGSEGNAGGPISDFEAAWAAHEPDVVRVCRRILGGREEVRDAPQEIYLKARRGFGAYDSSRPFRPWLLAIAGNHCIDWLRQRATEQRIFADLDPEEAAVPGSSGSSPLARVLAREEQDAVGRAIAGLPVKYRLPLALRYFSEMDYEAIAQALGVSRGQVGTLLFRAKQKLRESIERSPARRSRAQAGRRRAP